MSHPISSHQQPQPPVSPEEVDLRNLLLLDVRTPAEFGAVHIEGSVLHPLNRLDPVRVRQLAEGKEGVLLICRTGSRARQAAERLGELPGMRVLDGGILAWEAAALPLIRGRAMMSLERQVRIAAGALVFTGTALGVALSAYWLVLPAFVGAGLVFAGVSDTCGMGLLLARMPWNNRSGASCQGPSCCPINP